MRKETVNFISIIRRKYIFLYVFPYILLETVLKGPRAIWMLRVIINGCEEVDNANYVRAMSSQSVYNKLTVGSRIQRMPLIDIPISNNCTFGIPRKLESSLSILNLLF